MAPASPDIAALYARHGDDVLVFLVRRTADPELALDLWGETFAQAVVSAGRYRGSSDGEAAGWLFGITEDAARTRVSRGLRLAGGLRGSRASTSRSTSTCRSRRRTSVCW